MDRVVPHLTDRGIVTSHGPCIVTSHGPGIVTSHEPGIVSSDRLDGRPPGLPEAAGKGRVPFPAFLFSFQNDNVQNVGRNELSLK